jgi:hypothetical protein
MKFLGFVFVWTSNNEKDVDVENPQAMKCLFCYINPMHVPNPSTKERKSFITYYKTYGITTLKKHVDIDYALIVKILKRK